MIKLLIITSLIFCFNHGKTSYDKLNSFAQFQTNFIKGYQELNIPIIQYDYKAYFNEIPGLESLRKQKEFFLEADKTLRKFKRENLALKEQTIHDQITYEIDFNLQRINLEITWVNDGRIVPESGLYSLKEREAWCRLFIRKHTSLSLSPQEILSLGKQEVSRVQEEIRKIQRQSGYKDSISFYRFLKSESFYITDKNILLRAFSSVDSIIRTNLPHFMSKVNIPEVYPMEWSNSGPNTPPGIYMNHSDNPYGKDVFMYNFYGSRFNKRALEWLFMHEAIPGHHLQFSIRAESNWNELQELFSYLGNFEGWGCYVEYEGKDLGVYQDIYSYLGKWEWDLVRSVRLVLDAGIHFYGWTKQDALNYWKQNIIGQDEIAEREITRVTNWPAQALSYKVGADCISQIRSKLETIHASKFDMKRFHHTFLSFGMCPLEVIKKNFQEQYSNNDN